MLWLERGRDGRRGRGPSRARRRARRRLPLMASWAGRKGVPPLDRRGRGPTAPCRHRPILAAAAVLGINVVVVGVAVGSVDHFVARAGRAWPLPGPRRGRRPGADAARPLGASTLALPPRPRPLRPRCWDRKRGG